MNLSEYTTYDAVGLGQLVAAGEIRPAEPVSYTHLTLPTIYSV